MYIGRSNVQGRIAIVTSSVLKPRLIVRTHTREKFQDVLQCNTYFYSSTEIMSIYRTQKHAAWLLRFNRTVT